MSYIALSYEHIRPYLRRRPGRYEIDQIRNMLDRAKRTVKTSSNPHAHHWKAKRGKP